jgi:hypothetical protein
VREWYFRKLWWITKSTLLYQQYRSGMRICKHPSGMLESVFNTSCYIYTELKTSISIWLVLNRQKLWATQWSAGTLSM